MKKRTHKWINGTNGAISLMLAVLLSPFVSLAAVMVESVRIQSAVKSLDQAMGSSAISALADYDSYIQKRFGLLSLSQDGDLTETAEHYLTNIRTTDMNSIKLDSVSAEGAYPLSNLDILHRQVVEYGRVLVPTTIVTEGLDLDSFIDDLRDKLDKSTKIFNGYVSAFDQGATMAETLLEVQEAMDDIREEQDKLKKQGESYQKAFDAWAGSVGSLSFQLGIPRPDEKLLPDLAKLWDKAVSDKTTEERTKRSEYIRAIDDLNQKIASFKKNIEALGDKMVTVEKSMLDFGQTAYDTVVAKNRSDQKKQNKENEKNGHKQTQAEKDAEKNANQQQDFNNSVAGKAISSGLSAVKERMDKIADSVTANAKKQLEADRAKTNSFTSSITKDTAKPTKEEYCTCDLSELISADFLDEYNKIMEEQLVKNSGLDLLNGLIKTLNSILATKGIYDGRLSVILDNNFYNTNFGGLPGKKDRGDPAYSFIEEYPDDKQKSTDYMQAINPNYREEDPFGNGVSAQEQLILEIVKKIESVTRHCEHLKNPDGIKDFLESLGNVFRDLSSLVIKFGQFVGSMTGNLLNMVGDMLYRDLLIKGYMAYNLPNRTNYKNGSTMSGYSFSGIPYGDTPEWLDAPGGSLGALISIVANPGGHVKKAFAGAEMEYVMWGNDSEIVNQLIQFFSLYLFRLALDIPSVFSNAEIAAVSATIGGPFAPIIQAVFALAEAALDAVILVNSGSVSLVKLVPFLTIQGMDDLVKKMVRIGLPDEDVNSIVDEYAKATGQTPPSAQSHASEKGADAKKPGEAGKKPGEKPKKTPEGFLEIDYGTHSLLLMMVFGNSHTYMKRLSNLIQMECSSAADEAGKAPNAFDLDEAYTVVRLTGEGSVVPLFPLPQKSSGSVFEVNRTVYRGY